MAETVKDRVSFDWTNSALRDVLNGNDRVVQQLVEEFGEDAPGVLIARAGAMMVRAWAVDAFGDDILDARIIRTDGPALIITQDVLDAMCDASRIPLTEEEVLAVLSAVGAIEVAETVITLNPQADGSLYVASTEAGWPYERVCKRRLAVLKLKENDAPNGEEACDD